MVFMNISSRSATRKVTRGIVLRCVLFSLLAGSISVLPFAAPAQAPPKKPVAQKKAMTQADVEKYWKAGDDALLISELKGRGLAFAPSGEWLNVTLPKVTGVPPSSVPRSMTALRALVPKLDLDEVTTKAPVLITNLKTAAQKRSDVDLQPLVDPSVMANKALVYDIFDPTSFRAYTLGKPAEGEYGDVGMPLFALNSGNVEKLYYVRFSQFKGKLIIGDMVTGPEVADLYLHDEKTLAKTKLETMFRALNDGDQSGIKTLCTPGLYDAIQTWGGDKHPGDRLSHGHTVGQVTVETTVPLDQKSIRVVSKISYPLSAKSNIVFYIDFDRVDNELKMVRIRDDENKVIVYDPNIDNYLNRRYSLPDAPPLVDADVTKTEKLWAQPLDQLKLTAQRILQYHDVAKISELAQMLVEEAPTSGDGYGIRAAANLMQHKIDDADKDAQRALELDGTAYFIVERKLLSTGSQFGVVVLGVSRSKIDYRPVAGGGAPEAIDIKSVLDSTKFATGHSVPGLGKLPGGDAGPYLKLEFKGLDGKKKSYDLASYGTTCPKNDGKPLAPDLIRIASNSICGATSSNGQITGNITPVDVLTPQTWHEDLSVVLQAINSARGSSHK